MSLTISPEMIWQRFLSWAQMEQSGLWGDRSRGFTRWWRLLWRASARGPGGMGPDPMGWAGERVTW